MIMLNSGTWRHPRLEILGECNTPLHSPLSFSLCLPVCLPVCHSPPLTLSSLWSLCLLPLPLPLYTGFWLRAGHFTEADFPRLPKGYFTRTPIKSLLITNVPNHLQKNLFILCGNGFTWHRPLEPSPAFKVHFIWVELCIEFSTFGLIPLSPMSLKSFPSQGNATWCRGGQAMCQCCRKTRMMQLRCHFRVTNRLWQTIRKGKRLEWCHWQTAMTFGSFGLQSASRIQCLPQVSNGSNMLDVVHVSVLVFLKVGRRIPVSS